MAEFNPDIYLAQKPVVAPPTFDPDAYLSAVGQTPTDYQSVIPRQNEPGFLTSLGRGAASLADNTIGAILPAAAQQLVYPFARMGGTPEAAQATTRRIVGGFEQPFGKAFGVTNTPEYQQEGSRQLLNLVGEGFQAGAKGIATRTGLPASDVENMLGSATLAAPVLAKPVAKVVKQTVAPLVDKAVVGAKMPFEKAAQAAREKASLRDYAKGPQLDAIAEAKRLGIALNPVDVQPTAGPKITSLVAGEHGAEAIANANKSNVRAVVLKELDLSPTTQLDKGAAFDTARAKLAAPYQEIAKLPTIVADDTARAALEQLRPSEHLIGSDAYAGNINRIIDSALDKTTDGLSGAQLLENISTLRKRAKKTYNSKTADLAALDIADTNLAVANALEGMIDSNVTNPKLLGEFRTARQKMARAYAYEGATDLNTGFVDVSKLARITAKDNALTGDIASLGKIAGNFPDAFTNKASSGWSKAVSLGRTGAMGTAGALAGHALTGNYAGLALGGLGGAVLGKVAENFAANRLASPKYQAGLTLRDARIPVNQLAASMQPIPQNRSLVPYEAPVEVLDGSEAYSPNFTMPPNQYGPRVTTPGVEQGPAQIGMSRTPVGGQMGALRAEDARLYQQQAAAERQAAMQEQSAPRKPASGEVLYDLDPVTGKLIPTSSTLRGATPNVQVVESTGHALKSAAAKVQSGKRFDMTAGERVAWEKTKVDFGAAVPELKGLSDKAIAGKMMDRQWVSDTVAKLRQQDEMFKAKAAADLNKLRADDKAFKSLEAQMAWQKRVDAAATERASLISKLEDIEQSFASGVANRLAPNSKNSLRN
jgi:hypothetical protein